MYEEVDISAGCRRRVHCERVVTPGYRALLSSGQPLPDNPYLVFTWTADPGKYFYTVSGPGGSFVQGPYTRYVQDNDMLRSLGILMLDDQVIKLRNGRRNKALKKIKGASIPLIMLWKERHETGKMVTKLLDDMLFFAKNVRNPKRLLAHYKPMASRSEYTRRFLLNPKKVQHLVRKTRKAPSIGDAYLQWRFGWGPLYADIKESLAAAEVSEKKGITTRVKSSLDFNFHCEVPTNIDGRMGGIATVEGRYTIGYRYHITSVSLQRAAMLMDIPTTLWDAVPWSFIIDRIVNVSKYLDLRNATAGVEFSSGFESLKKKYVFSPRDTVVPLKYGFYRYSLGSVPDRVEESYQRSILSGFYEPILEYPMADFFDSNYWADYAALIRQRFRRRP